MQSHNKLRLRSCFAFNTKISKYGQKHHNKVSLSSQHSRFGNYPFMHCCKPLNKFKSCMLRIASGDVLPKERQYFNCNKIFILSTNIIVKSSAVYKSFEQIKRNWHLLTAGKNNDFILNLVLAAKVFFLLMFLVHQSVYTHVYQLSFSW